MAKVSANPFYTDFYHEGDEEKMGETSFSCMRINKVSDTSGRASDADEMEHDLMRIDVKSKKGRVLSVTVHREFLEFGALLLCRRGNAAVFSV